MWDNVISIALVREVDKIMEESVVKFFENLPNLLKIIAVGGIAKGVIGIYMILHKENKALRKENFELKDKNKEIKNQKICTNCKNVI